MTHHTKIQSLFIALFLCIAPITKANQQKKEDSFFLSTSCLQNSITRYALEKSRLGTVLWQRAVQEDESNRLKPQYGIYGQGYDVKDTPRTVQEINDLLAEKTQTSILSPWQADGYVKCHMTQDQRFAHKVQEAIEQKPGTYTHLEKGNKEYQEHIQRCCPEYYLQRFASEKDYEPFIRGLVAKSPNQKDPQIRAAKEALKIRGGEYKQQNKSS